MCNNETKSSTSDFVNLNSSQNLFSEKFSKSVLSKLKLVRGALSEPITRAATTKNPSSSNITGPNEPESTESSLILH